MSCKLICIDSVIEGFGNISYKRLVIKIGFDGNKF